MLASDLTALSSYLKTNFDYDTGAFNDLPDETPAKRFLMRSDYNISNAQQGELPLQPPRLVHRRRHVELDVGAAAAARRAARTSSDFQNTNYRILENIKSGIGEWNWVIGN